MPGPEQGLQQEKFQTPSVHHGTTTSPITSTASLRPNLKGSLTLKTAQTPSMQFDSGWETV